MTTNKYTMPMTPDLFVITSVINTGNVAWTYATRSVFSPEERFRQTLHTIKSIRDLCDNTKVMLVECSNISPYMETILCNSVDYYINCYDDSEAKYACVESNRKGYGEAVKSKIAVQFILENNIVFNRLFKISGRYWINSSFNKANFSEEMYTFNKFLPRSTAHPTVLYSVPFQLLKPYLDILCHCCERYRIGPIGLEELLPPLCNPKQIIDCIGASGYVAVSQNELWSIGGP